MDRLVVWQGGVNCWLARRLLQTESWVGQAFECSSSFFLFSRENNQSSIELDASSSDLTVSKSDLTLTEDMAGIVKEKYAPLSKATPGPNRSMHLVEGASSN